MSICNDNINNIYIVSEEHFPGLEMFRPIWKKLMIDGKYYSPPPPQKTSKLDSGEKNTTKTLTYKVSTSANPEQAAEVIHRDLVFKAAGKGGHVNDAFIPTKGEVKKQIVAAMQARTPKPATPPKPAVQLLAEGGHAKIVEYPKPQPKPSRDVPVIDVYHPSWKEKIEHTLESAWDKTFFGIFEKRLRQSMATEKNTAVRFFGGLAYSIDVPAMAKDAIVLAKNFITSPKETAKGAVKSLKDPFTWGALIGGIGTASSLSEGFSLAFDKPRVKVGVETERGKVVGLNTKGEYAYSSVKAYVRKIRQEDVRTKGGGLEVGVSDGDVNVGVFKFGEVGTGSESAFASHFVSPRFEEFQQGLVKTGGSRRAVGGVITRRQGNTIVAERFLSFGKSKDVGPRRYSVDIIQTESGKSFLAGVVNTEKELPLRLMSTQGASADAVSDLLVLSPKTGSGEVIGPLRMTRGGGLELDVGSSVALGSLSTSFTEQEGDRQKTSQRTGSRTRGDSGNREVEITFNLTIPTTRPRQRQEQGQKSREGEEVQRPPRIDPGHPRPHEEDVTTIGMLELKPPLLRTSSPPRQAERPREKKVMITTARTEFTFRIDPSLSKQAPPLEPPHPSKRKGVRGKQVNKRRETREGGRGVLVPAGEIDLFAADTLDAMGIPSVTVNKKKFIEHYEGPTGLFDEPLWLTEEFGDKKKRKKKRKGGFAFDLTI